jgi:hypothetical protein
LRFKKETIKNYTNADTGIFIKRCQHYSLFDNNKVVGHFYFGLDDSIGMLNDTFLTLRRKNASWTKCVFELQNCNNNVIVGEVAISNFVVRKSLKISLDIIHKEPYEWEVEESYRGGSIFTSTYSKFLARLFNNQEDLIIKWDYKGPQLGTYKLEELPVEGKIELKNPNNHFLLFAGLFLSEMELQRNVD